LDIVGTQRRFAASSARASWDKRWSKRAEPDGIGLDAKLFLVADERIDVGEHPPLQLRADESNPAPFRKYAKLGYLIVNAHLVGEK